MFAVKDIGALLAPHMQQRAKDQWSKSASCCRTKRE